MIEAGPGKILVEQMVEEIKSSLHIPEGVKNLSNEGKVVSIGCPAVTKKGVVVLTSVKVGDVVCFNEYDGYILTHEGKQYVCLDETDIFAIKEVA